MDSSQIKNRIKGKPELTKLEENDDGFVYMSWKLTAGAQKYLVEKYDRETDKFKKIAELPPEVNEYVDKNVEAASVYRYRIASRRKNDPDEVITRRGLAANIALSSPTVVSLSQVKHLSFGKTMISWEKDEGADGYRINRRPALTKCVLPLAFVEGDKLTYTDETEVSGQIYYYSVQSYRNCEDEELVLSKNSEERMVVNLNETEILSQRRSLGKKVKFSVRVTCGINSYILLKSSEENGEYKEVMRTKSGTDTVLFDKGAPGEKGAYYVIKCSKTYEGNEYLSNGTKPVFVRY